MFSVYYLFINKPTCFISRYYVQLQLIGLLFAFFAFISFCLFKKIRHLGYFCFSILCFDCDPRRRKKRSFLYKKFWSGTKIGNEAGVNLINSLSPPAIFWFIISYISSIGNERRNLRLFFCYGVMQYVTFSLFSLPVMVFRILEMYFFPYVNHQGFIKQKELLFCFFCKVLILLYLTYYYHMVFWSD